MGTEIDTISAQDRKLLELASNHYSGEEMEKKTGVPAAEAIVRVRKLLASREIWDEREQRQLILESAYRLKEKVETNTVFTDPKSVDSVTKLLKVISDMLDSQARISDAELQVVSKAQERVIRRMVEAGYEKAREKLEAEWGGIIDLDVIDDAFQSGMREAHLEING